MNSLTSDLSKQHSAAELQQREAQRFVDELTAQIQKLRSENHSLSADLQESLNQARDASASLAERDQKILTLREDLQEQKNQLAGQSNQQSRRFAESNDVVQENRRLLSRLSQLQANLRQQATRFNSERDTLQVSHQHELQAQLRSSKSSLTSARIELGHYQQQVSEWKQQVTELARRNSELERQSEELKRGQELAATGLQEAERDKAERDHTVAALSKQLSSLRHEMDEQKCIRSKERSELEHKIRAVEEAHATVQQQLNHALENRRQQSKKKETPTRHLTPTPQRKSGSTSVKKGNSDPTLISGIGPVAANNLREHGVNTIEQIAAWTDQDMQHFSEVLAVGGRIKNEKWIDQAKELIRKTQ